MPTLSNQQRIEEIEKALDEINPLNSDRIFLETSLRFSKENYFKSFDEKEKNEIIEIEKKLKSINNQLTPLFSKLRSLQVLYRVYYEGEVTETDNSKFMQPQTEYLNLGIDYNIDTYANGWNPYMNSPNLLPLLKEIEHFIFNQRYTNFNILHIKRM